MFRAYVKSEMYECKKKKKEKSEMYDNSSTMNGREEREFTVKRSLHYMWSSILLEAYSVWTTKQVGIEENKFYRNVNLNHTTAFNFMYFMYSDISG